MDSYFVQKMATNSHPWLPPSLPASLSFVSFFILPFILSKAKLSISALVYSPSSPRSPSLSSLLLVSLTSLSPGPGTSTPPATSPSSLTSQLKGILVCSSDCYWLLVIQSPSFFWKQLPLALAGPSLVTMWSASLAPLPAGEPMPLSSGLGSAWGGVGCSEVCLRGEAYPCFLIPLPEDWTVDLRL